MIGLVIVFLILLKDPAKHDGTCDQHKISSDDREDDGDKEDCESR